MNYFQDSKITSLHIASKLGYIDIIRCLILSGASADIPNKVSGLNSFKLIDLKWQKQLKGTSMFGNTVEPALAPTCYKRPPTPT